MHKFLWIVFILSLNGSTCFGLSLVHQLIKCCSWWWTNDSPKHVEPFNERIKTIHKNLCISLVYIHIKLQLSSPFRLWARCHRMLRRMQAFYLVKLLCPGTQFNGHYTTCISYTTSYNSIWKNFLQARSNMWLQYGSVPHFLGHKILESVLLWIPLNWSWVLTCLDTPFTALDLLWLLILMLHEWAGWCIRRHRRQAIGFCGALCNVSLTRNDHENLQEATRAAFKTTSHVHCQCRRSFRTTGRLQYVTTSC